MAEKPDKKNENITANLFAFDKGFDEAVGGCDEAGRGPLAGPVVCAAVVLPLYDMIEGINDSKKLSKSKREQLFSLIISRAICYHIEVVDREIIDDINILNATKLGMRRAINALKAKAEGYTILVDAESIVADLKTVPLIKGDSKSYNIAAASILAKVTRDRIMLQMDGEFPGYFFYKNMGYGTAQHIEALEKLGATPEHRITFLKNFFDRLPPKSEDSAKPS